MIRGFQHVRQQCRECSIRPGVIAFALSTLLVPGAFAQKVTTEFDEAVDFSRFKTFAIRDGQMNSKSPNLNSELTKKRVEREIERAFIARGMTKATGRSDLNIFFTFGSLPKMETETYPTNWRGSGTRVARVPYSQGTLVIDLRDPTTRSLVWRGVAIEQEANPIKLSDRLDEMVKKAAAKYPPKKTTR